MRDKRNEKKERKNYPKELQSIPFPDGKIFHYSTDVPSMLLHTVIIYRLTSRLLLALTFDLPMFSAVTCKAVNK